MGDEYIFPDDYAVVDTETNGFDRNDMWMVEFGYCVVKNRESVLKGGFKLEIPDTASMSDGAVEVHGLSRDHLKQHGVPLSERSEAIKGVHDLFQSWAASGLPIVGFNIVGFDMDVFAAEFRRAGLPLLQLPLMDTGMVMKALPHGIRRKKGEDLQQFLRKVSGMRLQGKWNADLCMQKYALDIPARGEHSAVEDSYIEHRITEAARAAGDIDRVLKGI